MNYWRLPLDADKHEVVIGKVNIIDYRCKGCKYCIEFCPNDVLEEATEFNEKGYYPPRVKKEGLCINCNFCESICPEFAIYCTVAERRTLRPADVIHQVPLSRRERFRRRQTSEEAPLREVGGHPGDGHPGDGHSGNGHPGGGHSGDGPREAAS